MWREERNVVLPQRLKRVFSQEPQLKAAKRRGDTRGQSIFFAVGIRTFKTLDIIYGSARLETF